MNSVSRQDGETYMDFIRRVKASGPDAVAVKMADIQDHFDCHESGSQDS